MARRRPDERTLLLVGVGHSRRVARDALAARRGWSVGSGCPVATTRRLRILGTATRLLLLLECLGRGSVRVGRRRRREDASVALAGTLGRRNLAGAQYHPRERHSGSLLE